jgi:hypothetical protein
MKWFTHSLKENINKGREGNIDCVIANEVKQSHKIKFRLLRRSTPRNDIDRFNETD